MPESLNKKRPSAGLMSDIPDSSHLEQLEKGLVAKNIPSKKMPRKPLHPKGITCPEGIWALEASIRLSNKENGDEGQDRKMGEIVQDFLHFLVMNPALEVFTISSYSGSKEAIDRDYLRGRTAVSHFLRGFIPFSDGLGSSDTDGRFIFVNKVQFENLMTDKPAAESAAPKQAEKKSRPYTPAYLQLMLDAVEALNLSADKRANMNEITGWLESNWPPGLDGKSERMIQSMATLLRRPQDKKGGNTRWSKE